MILKQNIQKMFQAQKDNENSSKNAIKLKPLQIGSIKNNKINFDSDEQFFNNDYIPMTARLAKTHVKQLIDPDILELKKKKWNMSVEAPKRFDQYQQNHQQKLFKIKSGFYDDKKVILKPNKIWTGTETRNSYKNWNVSVAIQPKNRQKVLPEKTMNALSNTVAFTSQNLKSYVSPVKRYELSLQKTRQLDNCDIQIRSQLKKKYIYDFPGDKESKVNVKVNKMLDEYRRNQLRIKMFGDSLGEQLKKQFHANLSSLQKSKILKQYYHTGIFGKVKAQEQEQVWSCCLNSSKQSKGCVYFIKDKNRKNLVSFNNE